MEIPHDATNHGHSQVYVKGKTREQKLIEELDRERTRCAAAAERARFNDRRRAAAQGQVTKIRNRVGHGVCPCCNRTFQNLLRHMATKHPSYAEE